MKTRILIPALVLTAMLFAQGAWAHCEVPCGIYDDAARIALMREHITTVEKSMHMVEELSGAESMNYNQIVRWVNNKETHADEIQHIVSQYFMTQRVKPVASDDSGYGTFVEKVTVLHQLLIEAMKSKQTLDHDHIDAMRNLVDRFEKLYFVKK